jgi:hypothetical protein
MVYCSSTGKSSQKVNMREVDLREGILVPAYDDSWPIAIEEKDMRLRMSIEEVCLQREVEVWICRVGKDCCF